jgi:purine-binding chemotaxis protein CheW
MSTATPTTTAAVAEDAEVAGRQLVVFTLGAEDFGVPITWVQEIIRHTPPRPVPGSPPHVEGVINLRGRIIPVIGLRTRFGVRSDAPEEQDIVIVQLGETTVGMIVDGVREVLTVADEQTEEPPAAATSSAADSISTVAKLEDRLLLVLDLPRLFGVG